MTNYQSGRYAEEQAAEYLRSRGYKIRELNWKTRWCEIDIVAEKDKIIYFVEIKYRRSIKFGRGLDYITPQKIKQMTFAAELWMSQHKWSGECELVGLGIDDYGYELTTVDRKN